MKKVLLITWTIALIVFCSYMKVKADSYQAYYLPTISSPTTQAGYIGKTYTIPAGGETGAKEINFETPTNITGYPVEIRIPIFIGYLTTGSIDNTVFYESNNSFAVSAKYTIKGQTTYSMTQYCILEQSAGENQNQVVARCPILNNYNIMGIRVSYQIRDYSNQQHNMFIGYNRNATIVYDNTQGITSTIQEQTQQQQQQYQEATNGTWTPNNNINTNQNGANETIEWGQQEEALLDSLDMNTTMLSDITINPTASAFIWDIVGGLRNMNPAIVMVMTSILGLGIAKMLLNR